MNIFSENIRKLLLIAPIREKVLSIDPGFKNGCKIAVLDKNGTIKFIKSKACKYKIEKNPFIESY